MHRAAYNNSLEAVKVLLAHGADVNARDDYSNTALHYAASYGHDALAQALLGAGADINAKTKRGATAVAYAREYGKREWRRCSGSTAPSEGACRGARRYGRERKRNLVIQIPLPALHSPLCLCCGRGLGSIPRRLWCVLDL
jgi:hypothetical protein